MNLVSFALKNGADDVVVEQINDSTTQIKFANSSVSASQDWSVTRCGVFVAVKNATAASSFQGLSQAELEAAVKRLISAAKKSKPSSEYFGLAHGPFAYKEIKNTYDKRVVDYDGTDAIQSAMNAAFENSKAAAGTFYKMEIERSVSTSADVEASEKKTKLLLSIRAFNEKNESGHFVSCSCNLKDFHPEQAGSQAGEVARLAKNPVQGDAGRFDVIFAPMAIGNLLARVGEFSTAFNVDSGFSCFANKLGGQVASKAVSVSDNGCLENGYNSSAFDDEGVPTRETKIIENGTLKTYLHNTSSAKKYNTKTTANAGLIAQRYHNIMLAPGKITKEKLLEGVKRGFFVTNVWYTRFQNFYSGDFSTIPRDGVLFIKDGEVAGSVTNVRITDNMLRILSNVTSLSDKAECVQWWDEINPPVYTPYVLVKDVNLTLPTM